MSYINYSACLSALKVEQNHYESVVYISLSVTLICCIIRTTQAEKFQNNPNLGAKVLFSFAGLKVLLGITLLALFPGCPDVCESACTSPPHHYIYPIIVFAVAFMWCRLGDQYRKLANANNTREATQMVDNTTIECSPTHQSKKELV